MNHQLYMTDILPNTCATCSHREGSLNEMHFYCKSEEAMKHFQVESSHTKRLAVDTMRFKRYPSRFINLPCYDRKEIKNGKEL